MPKDNYAETARRLARFILDHRPEGLRRSTVNDLISIAESVGDEVEHFYGMEFRRPMTETLSEGQAPTDPDRLPELSCTLYVGIDDKVGLSFFHDEDGNKWSCYRVSVTVNWPSFGSNAPELAGQRISYMDEVCQLARLIEANFQEPVYHLVATTAQQAEWKAKYELDQKVDQVRKAIISHSRLMRVGQQRVVVLPEGATGQWKGEVSWGRPGGDLWKFSASVDDRHLIFVRTA